ncbi:MAG TPA: XrtA system polysaccharide deacetylase [Candidatus Acidoferrales bacterium]|nr:XrtA system polysaccharide deacetylase [Candidatus Acidoferrales bacterium]
MFASSTNPKDRPAGELVVPPGATAAKAIRHILSVDVEDYFQVEAFANVVSRESWDYWPCRVVESTRVALDLFDRHQAKATFFFLGWVAQRFPELVREVHSRGHELACHSFWHRPVYTLTPQEFREDTRRAREVIQQAAGVRVLGYRAPTWSITNSCLWALDILAEEGFAYDSSIYPIRHDLYGVPGACRFPYTLTCGNGKGLREFPPSTVRVAGVTLPVAGGGYLRILPFRFNEWAFRHIETKYGQPVVVYFHPWEFDPDQPRIPAKPRSRFRHYTNLRETQDRVRRLLELYMFQPFRALLPPEANRRATVEVGRGDYGELVEGRRWESGHGG